MPSVQPKYTRVSNDTDTVEVEAEAEEPKCEVSAYRWRITFLAAVVLILLYYLADLHGQKFIRQPSDVEDSPVEAIEIPNETLFEANMQGRAEQVLGKPEHGFSLVNERRKQKRLKDMAELDAVRVGYCKGVHDREGKWVLKEEKSTVVYANSSVHMAMLMRAWRVESDEAAWIHAKKMVVRRRICEAPHPRLKHAKVRIERIGPFCGEGNYDWTAALGVSDAMFFSKLLKSKDLYVLGRMVGAVDANGTMFNYPPIHVHHAHIYPYKRTKIDMRVIPRNLWKFNNGKSHHVLIQAHGDAICKEEDGGTACLLEQLPDGHGYRVAGSSGFSMNFETNDVRSGKAPRLEYYVDVAVIYTEKPQIATTFMQMGNPALGLGWETYLYPLDPHHNFIYYNYTNHLLGNGTISNFILHTHMSSFDAIYVLKGAQVYKTLENYRKRHSGTLPFVFECKGQNPAQSKSEILRRVLATPGAELLCEGTRPSLEKFCEPPPNDHLCTYRDKRIGFNCLERARLLKDESIIVLAFNRVRNTSTTALTRQSDRNALAIVSPFGMGYVAHQHSFFRADFVSDAAMRGDPQPSSGDPQTDFDAGNYAPPAIFSYSTWPQSPASGYHTAARKLIKGCKVNIDYNVDLPWNIKGF